jgi:ABC-type nitrate/sulfonate/bicarbonate transport system substrate-binding protein
MTGSGQTAKRAPRVATAVVVAASACLLSACGVKQEAVKVPTARPFSVTLGGTPNAFDGALYSAVAHGQLHAAGLSVTVLQAPGSTQALQALAAQTTDMAVVDQSQLLLARDQGLRLVSIAALGEQPLGAQLQHAGSAAEASEAALAKRAGGSGIPATEDVVLAVRVRQAEDEGENLRAFMQALTEASAEVRTNPAQAAALVVAAAHIRHPHAQSQAITRALSAIPAPTSAAPYGYQAGIGWEAFARWMYVAGLLHTDPTSLSQPYTDEYLAGQGV